MRIKVVGAGGIGSHLLPVLCQYLDSRGMEVHILVLDGDQYDSKNASRQVFHRVGNKAEVSVESMRGRFPRLSVEASPFYVSEDNAFIYIEEGDIVLSCVDNHKTRLLLSRQCETLEDVALISGGNEYTDGNVQVFLRRSGINATPPLTHLHPEIADPQDQHPEELSCEALAQAGVPQLIFTNLAAASAMLNAFWLLTTSPDLPYSECYFDINTGAVRPVNRKETLT